MSLSENQMQDLDTWEHGNMIKTQRLTTVVKKLSKLDILNQD
jgi:hypothetical protein